MKLAVSTRPGYRTIIGELPPGDEGIRTTIGAMQALVTAAQGTPIIEHYALSIAALARGSGIEYPFALEKFLRGAVVFRPDPAHAEDLQDPVHLLTLHQAGGGARPVQGDCDDRAMMGAALLTARDYSAVLIVVGPESAMQGGAYKHVFYGFTTAQAHEPVNMRNTIPFDPQERMTPGVWPSSPPRLAIFRV